MHITIVSLRRGPRAHRSRCGSFAYSATIKVAIQIVALYSPDASSAFFGNGTRCPMPPESPLAVMADTRTRPQYSGRLRDFGGSHLSKREFPIVQSLADLVMWVV